MSEATKLSPFLVRLRPETRALLDRAAEDQRRSRASLIDQAVSEMLGNRYTGTSDRLAAMLGTK
jgi:predicted transcriptional regulator